jgi:hypothetical protein
MTGHGAWASLAEAARLTGKSEKTLKRWAAAGKLTIDRSSGRPRIQVADLIALGLVDKVGESVGGHDRTQVDIADRTELDRLAGELAAARARAEDLERDRDAWRLQAQRLAEAMTQLALPPAPEEPPLKPPPKRRGFWAWFTGRKEGA